MRITAVDAASAPVAGVTVPPFGVTDAAGVLALPVDGRSPLTLTFTHPAYVSETVTFKPDAVAGAFDNALVSRTVRGGDVSLRVQLGRCAAAPTKYVEDADIPKLGADPRAVLLFHPPKYPREFGYRFQWYADVDVRLARPELLPLSQPGVNSHGWSNFATDASGPIPIDARGRFFFLTYSPRAADTQYLIAVWSPDVPTTVTQLSMVLFYSPHTQSYAGTYPYGLVADPHGGPMDQPFITLGTKYLLNEYAFAYELAGRGNPSVIVMPLCRRDLLWGPFSSGEGAARLLAEVAVFLQRECRTIRAGSATPGIDPLYRLAGASLRGARKPITATDFGVTPPVSSVAVSFFSTGAAPAKSLMTNWGLSGGFASPYWGMPGNNAESAWAAAWREIWDTDGFHPATGGWNAYLTLLQRWYAHDKTRAVRLCHSAGRVPRDPDTDPSPFFRDLLRDPVTFRRSFPDGPPGPGWARELHTARSSVIAFADGYVAGSGTTAAPVLGDAHHATCTVAFSHAGGMTNVGAQHPVP